MYLVVVPGGRQEGRSHLDLSSQSLFYEFERRACLLPVKVSLLFLAPGRSSRERLPSGGRLREEEGYPVVILLSFSDISFYLGGLCSSSCVHSSQLSRDRVFPFR